MICNAVDKGVESPIKNSDPFPKCCIKNATGILIRNAPQIQMDGSNLQEIYQLAINIANNINQIAVRINSTSNIYVDDIAEIKDGVNRLWQPLNFMQTKILQLKH